MRCVVYTAIVGSYDSISQPDVIDEFFDYVLFSDIISDLNIGVWQIRPIPYVNIDNTRIARWVKTHPEDLFPEYEASIWIDANVVIRSDFLYTRARDLFSQKIVISSMWHNVRNCIYDEAAVVAYLGLEKESVVLTWLRKLKQASYPHHFGLYETNLVFRILHNELVSSLDDEWWNCIDNYSRRDQLSFNYCLWKRNLVCPFFISSTENTRNSEHFQYIAHKRDRIPFISKKDIVYYCRDLSGFDSERLRVLYEKLVRFRGFLFIRAVVASYYRVICSILKLKRGIEHRLRTH